MTELPHGTLERRIAATSGSRAATVTFGGARMRVLTTHVAPDKALQIARPLADDDGTLSRLRLVLALLAISAVLVAVLLGGWIAKKVLAPMERLTQTAEDVARTRDLSVRLDEDGRDEVARLGAAFNEMLVALDRSVTAQRRLVAHASHEFRTPLTGNRANAELLERGRVQENDQSAVARAVVNQVDELDGLVTDLIELALDGAAATHFEDVRLDEIVSVEVERMRRHAGGVRLDLVTEPCTVHGDPERLGRAVANVLINALKWSRGRNSRDSGSRRGRRRPRRRPGHRRSRPAARVRALLPLADGAREAGVRTRTGDRSPRSRGPRRHRPSCERSRRRCGLHAPVSPR